MNANTPRYTHGADLETHETEDGLVVFNPGTDCVHHLNYTASVLFELCQGAHTAAELAGMMAKIYALEETPSEVIETSLQQLVADGLLVETGAE